MKWKQKTIATMASILTVGMLITGCTKSGEPSSNNSQGSSTSQPANQSSGDSPFSEPLELGVAIWDIQGGFQKPNAKDDTIYNDLIKKFNITINPVQITWNDWQEKAKVWAASKQLPDVFANALATDNVALYQMWAKQGVIKAIPDDLSEYPNLQKLFSLDSVQPLKVDGKFYMIPRGGGDETPGTLARPIRYRKDWALQAGYTSEPKNFEDFLAMTKAVMKQHPGIAGLTINNKEYLLTQFLGSFPEFELANSWVKEDEKWIPSFTSNKVETGIQQLRTLYTDGVLDRDFAIQKDGDGVNKFLTGQSFALYGLEGVPTNVDQFKQANPGVKISDALGYLDIWPATDGKRYYFNSTPYWSETYFPSSLSEEKFDRALRLVDYMISEDYQKLRDNGIEDVDYKMENGQYTSLLKEGETVLDKYPITTSIAFLGTWNNGFYRGQVVPSSDSGVAELQKIQIETNQKRAAEYTAAPVNFDIFLMSTPAKNKLSGLNANIIDDIVKVILGEEDPVTQWKKIVKGYDAKGVQEAIKEVNEEAAKKGIK